jgi:hypothetical protein
MCIRNSALVAVCSTVIFSTFVAAKDIAIYRWVDEDNIVHFSQHEPQGNSYSQLTTFSSFKAKQESESDNPPLPSVDEQLSEYEKKKAEISEKNKVIAEKNCKAAQLNIKMLNTLSKVTILDSDGKNRVLTAKEKDAQLKLSNKHVDLYCKKPSNPKS